MAAIGYLGLSRSTVDGTRRDPEEVRADTEAAVEDDREERRRAAVHNRRALVPAEDPGFGADTVHTGVVVPKRASISHGPSAFA